MGVGDNAEPDEATRKDKENKPATQAEVPDPLKEYKDKQKQSGDKPW